MSTQSINNDATQTMEQWWKSVSDQLPVSPDDSITYTINTNGAPQSNKVLYIPDLTGV